MTPTELADALREAKDAFPVFSGRLTIENVREIRRKSATVLRKAKNYNEANGFQNLSSVVLSAPAYRKKYKLDFVIPPNLGLLHPWPDKTKPSQKERDDAQRVHDAKRTDNALYVVGDDGVKELIFHAVDPEWYDTFEDEEDGYENVTAQEILDYLEAHCLGTNDIAALDQQERIGALYQQASNIPGYIKLLEKEQTKSKDSEIPIDNKRLVAYATRSLKKSKDYPDEMKLWDKMNKSVKTWDAWKAHFTAAWDDDDRAKRIAEEVGDGSPFAGAAAGSGTLAPAPPFGLSANSAAQLSGCMENVSLSLTQEANAVSALREEITANFPKISESLESLAKSVDRLSKENGELRREVNALRKKVEAAGGTTPPPKTYTSAVTGGANQGRTPEGVTLKPGFPFYFEKGMNSINSWIPGKYCHTCGYGTVHDSKDCRRKKLPGHKDTATRANTMGGAQQNKGWDE